MNLKGKKAILKVPPIFPEGVTGQYPEIYRHRRRIKKNMHKIESRNVLFIDVNFELVAILECIKVVKSTFESYKTV